MDMKNRFCILLPTKNEEINIKPMINSIRKVCKHHIIVNDENSEDNTAKIAKSLGVDVYQRGKKGYGEAVKESLKIAYDLRYTHLLIMDCDQTYPVDYIPELIKYANEGYDLVNGGRKLHQIKPLHIIPNIIHTMLTNILYFANIKDVNSGMKLLRIDKFIDKLKVSGNDSTVETIIVALKNRYKIKEIRIPYYDRYKDKKKGKAKIKYRDGFIILKRIIMDRFVK